MLFLLSLEALEAQNMFYMCFSTYAISNLLLNFTISVHICEQTHV